MSVSPATVPASILVVDDDPAIRRIIKDRLLAAGHKVSVADSGLSALQELELSQPTLMILDLRMPGLDGFGVLETLKTRPSRPDVVVITAHGSIDAAVRAIQLGAIDFIPKPFEPGHFEHVVGRVLDASRLRRRIAHLETELSGRHVLVQGKSGAMNRLIGTAERAAASQATVLLLGESGSGKEVIARLIHEKSPRSSGPFVALNCATLSAELLTSELFGHEKGAFTGAVKTKSGRLELAAGGSLFLDEIGELPPELQAKLLRVLQEKEFDRLGGTQPIKADVRIIAATHRDLAQAILNGDFREDLYYRLNVVTLKVPPLRERREDILLLANYFLQRHAREAGRRDLRLAKSVQERFACYDWPGNVRELSNVIERCVVLALGDEIDEGDLPEEIRDCGSARGRASVVPIGGGAKGFHEQVADAKRRIIEQALSQTQDHQTRAAELLGLTQPYLARLMKNFGLQGPRKKT